MYYSVYFSLILTLQVISLIIPGSLALFRCLSVSWRGGKDFAIVFSGLIAILLFVGLPAMAHASNGDTQFYADNCGLPNDGVHDDAAPLRSCMASMPPGSTMNLDGTKPYYFASHSSSDPVWGGNGLCETYLRSQQTLNLNGANIVQSNTEGAVGNVIMICAGTNNQNTPRGQFYQVKDTAANATSLITASAADAGNISNGDYLYIDCGSNSSDQDIFVGWDEACGAGNAGSGLIPLCYPLLKPYTAAECSGGSPRIFDYSTSTVLSDGSGGPLAENVWIENGTLTEGFGTEWAPIVFAGIVGGGVIGVTEPNSGYQFMWANNNHLSLFKNDSMTSTGCGGDTNFNPGEFTSSLNWILHDTATLTGIGCASDQFERTFGESEGGEANYYAFDVSTILAGGSPNANSPCAYAVDSWGDTFDHFQCNSAYEGFADQGQGGASTITDGYFSCGTTNCLTLEEPGDLAIGNTINQSGGAIAIYIPGGAGWAQASGNVINVEGTPPVFGAMAIGSQGNYAYSSQIGPNTFNCLASGCSSRSIGIYVVDPGTVLPAAPLTIADQVFNGFATNIALLGSVQANVPQLKILGPSQ